MRNSALWGLCIHENDCTERKETQTGVDLNWHNPHGTSVGKCLQCPYFLSSQLRAAMLGAG